MNSKSTKKTKIIIAGGGFAGLYAAMHFDKRLARRADVEITLISRDNFILFTPLLHEVAAGDLYPGDIVNPLRRILRHVKVIEGDVQSVDLEKRRVLCTSGLADRALEFEFDHLLLALGSETNFFNMDGVRDWSITMKSLADAALLRNRMVALLEEASLQKDEAARRRLLTFVTAGGGFSGTETTGAVNDFVRATMRYYSQLREELVRVVMVHPGNFILPELGEELGRYAERKLRERKVDVIKGPRVANYDGVVVTLSDGTSIPTATLIWTAGVKPSPVIASLGCKTERGRLLVNEDMSVPGVSGLWAAGDCAAIPDVDSGTGKLATGRVRPTGGFYPPTAQHALREGVIVAKNIEATILCRPLKPFRFKMLGQLASIGHHTGVAMMFGIKFSGFIAWCFWRSVYLMKLPRLAKKLRVMASWTLDIFFGQEIEQMITVRDIDTLTGQLSRIRARAMQAKSTSTASVLATSGNDKS